MKSENAGIAGLFLAALSGFYYSAVSARAFLYRAGLLKTKRLPVRVISVGNLTTGGVGKTPMVISLARLLGMDGKKAGIISRGYGRKDESALLVVSDGNKVLAGAEEAGDEPLVIATNVPLAAVVVCADRYKAGLHAVEKLGCKVLILDDGYQRLDLHRDLNILLADASAPFGNGWLLPRGHLREPISAISRADTVVLTRTEATEGKIPPVMLGAISAYAPHATLWLSTHEPVDFVDGRGKHIPLGQLKNRGVYLFSGIASPGSFRLLAEGLGAKITGQRTFGDHHAYTGDELKVLDREAMDSGAELLLTTEKDWVKIESMASEVRLPLWVMKIELRVKDLTGHWLKLVSGHHG
ncbi:MAG: tetraacyldisaccharide 4'-kinase [Nitrospirota bacterium]|nr:tetraacyldisaccharide 4'-kinase [Nitrospirota bacterium]